MPLSVPDYIRVSGILGAPIEHQWDDSDPELVYAQMDERLQHRIGAMSDRAVLTFSAGCAEWVAWRMAMHTDDPFLFQRIEATYAADVDWRYLCRRGLPERRGWQGPVRGPVWAAASLLDQMVDLLKRGEFASPESVCLSYLVLHIIPDPTPFKEWRRFAIRRLARLYPIDKGKPLGPPVPREALDPTVEITPESAPVLLSAFLNQLNPEENPYLCSPAEMTAARFEGRPYVL